MKKETKIICNMDFTTYKKKPVEDVNKINFRLVGDKNRNQEIEIERFMKLVINGCTFTPAVLDTPIYDDPYEKELLTVTQEEFNLNKNKNNCVIKNKETIREFEVNKPIYRRKMICWTMQQIFALDFDNGITEVEALSRCKQYGLKPFWLYNSFSSKKDYRKFRLLFKFDTPVNDYRLAMVIQKSLMTIFPECDEQCSDTSRLFFGTNATNYKLYNRHVRPEFSITVEDVFKAVYVYFKIKDSIHFARNIKTFAANNGLFLYKSNNIIFGDKEYASESLGVNDEVFNAYHDGVYVPFAFDELTVKYNGYQKSKITLKNGKTKTIYVRDTGNKDYRVDMNKLKEKCKLVREAYNANYELGHNEYFKLMQLFINLHGGDSSFEEIVLHNKEVNKYNAYDPNVLLSEYSYLKVNGYNLPLCDGDCKSGTCPYVNECEHARTPLSTFGLKDNNMETIEEYKNDITIDEAYEKTEFVMKKWYSNNKPQHLVLNSPTGVGKTEAYINIAQAGDVIALPSHALVKEVAERFKALNKEIIVSRERPDLAYEEDQKYYKLCQEIGLGIVAARFWKDRVNDYKDCENKNGQMIDCIKWQEEQQEVFNTSDKIIICTHHKLPYLFAKNDNIKNVFIDEDPIRNILIKTSSVIKKDMDTMRMLLTTKNADSMEDDVVESTLNKFIKICKELNVKKPDVFYYDTFSEFTDEEIDVLYEVIKGNVRKFKSNIDQLFAEHKLQGMDWSIKALCNYDKKHKFTDMVIIDKYELPKDKNIIILSATVPEFIAKQFNFKYEEVDFNYYNENIIFYGNESYSKSNLERMIKNGSNALELNYIKNIIGDTPVITMKNMKLGLNNLGFNIVDDIHYGNVAGFDKLKGQDIAILGTYNLNEVAYKAFALALNIDITNSKMKNGKYIRNGKSFKYYAFEEEDLREIQFYMIESEIVQAIGRARTYRTNAKVYVFANFPIKGAKIMNVK